MSAWVHERYAHGLNGTVIDPWPGGNAATPALTGTSFVWNVLPLRSSETWTAVTALGRFCHQKWILRHGEEGGRELGMTNLDCVHGEGELPFGLSLELFEKSRHQMIGADPSSDRLAISTGAHTCQYRSCIENCMLHAEHMLGRPAADGTPALPGLQRQSNTSSMRLSTESLGAVKRFR